MAGDVKFIRKNGRIIPIRSKKSGGDQLDRAERAMKREDQRENAKYKKQGLPYRVKDGKVGGPGFTAKEQAQAERVGERAAIKAGRKATGKDRAKAAVFGVSVVGSLGAAVGGFTGALATGLIRGAGQGAKGGGLKGAAIGGAVGALYGGINAARNKNHVKDYKAGVKAETAEFKRIARRKGY